MASPEFMRRRQKNRMVSLAQAENAKPQVTEDIKPVGGSKLSQKDGPVKPRGRKRK